MSIDPPEDLPTWDTGDNNSDDPGVAKRAAGWTLNEVPSSAHLNWLLQQSTEWINFLQKMTAPQTFAKNMTLTSDTAFATLGGNATMNHIRYIDGLGKYYAIARNGGGTAYAYDSLDGITWDNETSLTGVGPISKIASDGVNLVCWRYETELLTSTTGSVAGLTSQGNAPTGGGVRDDCDCVYDAFNDQYIMTAGEYVWTLDNSADDVHNDGDWLSTKDWGTDSIEGIAVSPSGKSVITFNTTGSAISADGGNTWSTKAGAVLFTTPIWSPASNCFFAFDDASNDLYFMPDNAGTNSWTNLNLNIDRFLVHEDVTIGIFNSTPIALYAFNYPVNFDGGNPQLNYAELCLHETPDGTGSILSGDLGGYKVNVPGEVTVIECVGEAKNLVWTRASNDVCYAKMK